MVNTCSVFGCNSRGVRDSTASFHRFPRREKSPKRHETWVNFCQRKCFRPANCSYICSKHFLESDFDSSQVMKLKLLPGENLRSPRLLPGTVPSVKCESPSTSDDDKRRRKSQTKNVMRDYLGDPDDPDENPIDNDESDGGIFGRNKNPPPLKLIAKKGTNQTVGGCSIRTDIFRECDSSTSPEPEENHERSQKPYHNVNQIVKQDPDALDGVHLYTMEEEEFPEEPIIHQQPTIYCQSFITSGHDDRVPSPPPIPSTGTGTGLGRSRKKRRAVISAAVEKLHEVNQSLQEFLEDEDDFDAFGNFVALSLKKLPLEQALEAQTEMQNTLTKFRLMHLNSSTSCGTSQTQRSDFPTHGHTDDQPPQPPVQFYITENSS